MRNIIMISIAMVIIAVAVPKVITSQNKSQSQAVAQNSQLTKLAIVQ